MEKIQTIHWNVVEDDRLNDICAEFDELLSSLSAADLDWTTLYQMVDEYQGQVFDEINRRWPHDDDERDDPYTLGQEPRR